MGTKCTGTSPGGLKNAFGSGVGLAHEFGQAMAKERVTPAMLDKPSKDPILRSKVGALLRGETISDPIKPQDWVDREMEVGQDLAKCGLPLFDQGQVETAAEMGVGIHHRFVPAFSKENVGRRRLLEVAEKLGIKLNGGNAKSADCDGEEIPNKAGIFTIDYNMIFAPTNSEHHPFMLNYDQQWSWACEQGGNGFSTVAKTLYVAVIRPRVELGKLPYMGGSIRCQDACGSGFSLHVRFCADDGLDVVSWDCSNQYWAVWALPEVFQEL